MNLLSAVHRFFAHLFGSRKPLTQGAIARMRLEEFRREQSRNRWEILPRSSEDKLPFGTQPGTFRDGITSSVTEQPASRIKISVNRLR